MKHKKYILECLENNSIRNFIYLVIFTLLLSSCGEETREDVLYDIEKHKTSLSQNEAIIVEADIQLDYCQMAIDSLNLFILKQNNPVLKEVQPELTENTL